MEFFPLFNIQLNFAFSTEQTTSSLQWAFCSYADIHQGWEVRQESAIHSHVKTEHLCRYKQDNSVAGLQQGANTASSTAFCHILFATNYYNSLLLNTQLPHWRRPNTMNLNMHQNTTTHAIGINPHPIHATKANRGKRVITPLILNLGTR